MTVKSDADVIRLKNVCAIANYVQVLLLEGYRFDEQSLPSISFKKKVRNKRHINLCVYYLLGFQSVSVRPLLCFSG